MRRTFSIVLLLFIILIGCSGPQPHLFVYKFNQKEALEVARSVLSQLHYKIAVYDRKAAVIKTKPREYLNQEKNETVVYQIVVTLTRPHEMRVKVAPRAAVDYRDEIMAPVVQGFDEVGIEAKYIPPPRRRPWKRPTPPYKRM